MIRQELIGRQFEVRDNSTIAPERYTIQKYDNSRNTYTIYWEFGGGSTQEYSESSVHDLLDGEDWVLLAKNYNVVGMPLPIIPIGTPYRIAGWSNRDLTRTTSNVLNNFVSYGSIELNGIIYVTCELPGDNNPSMRYLIPLSEILMSDEWEQGLNSSGTNMGIESAVDNEGNSFVLPNTWHCIVTELNQRILSQWRFRTNSTRVVGIGDFVGMTISFDNIRYVKGHNPIGNIGGPGRGFDFGIEITYQEFLKHVLHEEEFVLPENWAVKITADTLPAINEYRVSKDKDRLTSSAQYPYIRFDGFGIFTLLEYDNSYTEITYEQFKKYVLKKQDNLTFSDFKDGDYIYEQMDITSCSFITKVNIRRDGGMKISDYFINLNTKVFDTQAALNAYTSYRVCRYATPEEIEWLEACKKVERYIPKEEALKDLFKKEPLYIEAPPTKGYSMTQFAKALELIPWMEKDDAKDIFIEVKKYFETIKIEKEEGIEIN